MRNYILFIYTNYIKVMLHGRFIYQKDMPEKLFFNRKKFFKKI